MKEYIEKNEVLDIIDWHSRNCSDESRMVLMKVSDGVRGKHGIEGISYGSWTYMDDCMAYCSECFGLGCGSRYCPNCGAVMVNSDQGDFD